MKKVVYNALYGNDAFPFNGLGERVIEVRKPEDIVEEDGVLILWGGADVDPSYYGHAKSMTTGSYIERDRKEYALAQHCIKMGVPIIGICRGAQFLCAMAGGWLIQDTTNHARYGNHAIKTFNGRSLQVNSLHHQMLAGLEDVEHELLAWCDEPLSKYYIKGADEEYTPPSEFKEPELVWFPKIKGIAAQWHPEGMSEACEATEFLLEVIHGKI